MPLRSVPFRHTVPALFFLLASIVFAITQRASLGAGSSAATLWPRLARLPSSALHLPRTLRTVMTQQTLPPPAIAPVWFIAHGGPPTLYQPQHPAHQHWLRLGRDIRRTQPKGIVFVSAHWQAEPEDFLDGSNASGATDTNGPSSSSASAASRRVLINTDSSNPLIYDFYGFPKHYYEANFASHNPPVLHEAVSAHLRGEGYTVQETQRGIDHGVWVPLLAAFGERGMLDGEGKSVGGSGIPLVQVSLPIPRTDPRDDGAAALALGHALRGLRQQGIAVVGGGQPVHNLRDYRLLSGGLSPAAKDHYSQTFPPALTAALLLPSGSAAADASNGSDGSEPTRWAAAKALFSRADYAQAHPTSEHLLPVLVALGAAHDNEPGEEEFALSEGALGWNMYRFG